MSYSSSKDENKTFSVYIESEVDYISNQLHELKGYTLIVGCSGVGNVSQLACELIISNMKCVAAAKVDFSYLPAVAGLDPFVDSNSSRLLSTCQDDELEGSQLRYAVTEKFKPSDLKELERIGWILLSPHAVDECPPSGDTSAVQIVYHLSGSGVARRLFELLTGPSGAPVCLLNMFVSEGDNSQDALCMTQHLDTWLKMSASITKAQPASWTLPSWWSTLYGQPASDQLY